MRILLTGASGFIGREIVRAASDAGHEVRSLDRVANDGRRPDVNADLADGLLDEALDDIDVVCHQAAKVGLGVHLDDMPDYVRDNDLGSARLLAAMGRRNVPSLVLASSMVVYGEGAYRCGEHGSQPAPPRSRTDLDARRFDPGCPVCGTPLTPELVNEDAPLDPRNSYAVSKVTQEHLSRVWAHSTGGQVIALRYHNVYGPGMPRDTPYAGVASIFRSQIAAGRPPQVYEDGAQRRDFVHVDDVAAANVVALTAVTRKHTSPSDGAADGPAALSAFRVYNVGSGQVRTVHDMAAALSGALGGRTPVVTGQYRLGDVRHITASSQRIRDQLGWRPAVDFGDGMKQLAAQ